MFHMLIPFREPSFDWLDLWEF
uniref:Uncharacterized protein n=1 Tax=Ralstonia solanacearum TaxID=305 RepID=A0A0S4UXH0_RALSL|nr:protein of unknown function [Ralstonia solanacearum]